MGEIVGAGLISHVPPLVMPEAIRRELNNGEDTTLYEGLHDLGAQRLAPLEADTVVVVDTHWFTTVEHIVTAHERRKGLFTSDELPRGMCAMPYDMHYPTINLLPFLQGDEAWVSAGICQTAEPDDFLLFGELLSQAVAGLDRRVVVLASGGLSHRFWPLRQFRQHEAADPALHLRTPEAKAADEHVIDCLIKGDHAGVLDFLPEFSTHAPEGFFGHYLTMVGALGGTACTAPGEQFGEYESVAGTGQVHLWFSP